MSLETPNQVVSQEASAPSTDAVNEQQAETTATETTATTDTNEQAQVESQETTQTAPEQIKVPLNNSELYDERGVPWKNVALEHRRKYEETQATLPKLIAEEVAKIQQPQQKSYSIAELEQFAQANPEHRAWVEEEKAKVLKSELSREFDQRIAATAKAQQDEVTRREAFKTVISQFPDVAIKDQSGNFLGWNNLSPMTQAMGKYLSDPRLASEPNGMMIAAKLAYADTMMANIPKTQKQVQTLKQQVRKAQASGMVEGGGRKPGAENPNKKLMERAKATGKIDDAAAVMGNILRAQGQMKG